VSVAADYYYGTTRWFVAAQDGHAATVAKLLKSGADKSLRGYQDQTPLEIAEEQGHAAVVALLRT
jgi:ankyrin repeat protein